MTESCTCGLVLLFSSAMKTVDIESSCYLGAWTLVMFENFYGLQIQLYHLFRHNFEHS